jgi:hypothetical protein
MKTFGWGLLIITLIAGIFFKGEILDHKVLVPGDIVIGMYLPWLTEKWGYTVGVPVKNPIVSDIVSQEYIWKKLVAEAFRSGSLPLWNPYSYSGYPLLANFQSGALYPFNLLMVWRGDLTGWNWLLIFGTWWGMVTMYLFLRNKGIKNTGAIAGAVSYGLSMQAIVWMEYVTTAQMMAWFPLLLLTVDRMKAGKNEGKLMLPGVIYMLITAGRFEVLIYMLGTTAVYALSLGRRIWKYGLLIGVGIALGAIQIWPTVEMGLKSIRFNESYIAEQRWGLIPAVQLITGIAPDFFGNPGTGNHWGWWHYHETVFYTGIMAVAAITAAIFGFKILGKYKFFLGLTIFALVMGVDNPVSVAVMRLKIPILSTVSAGRIFVLFTTGAAVLVGWWINNIKKFSPGVIARSWIYPILALTVMTGTIFGIYRYLENDFGPVPQVKVKLMIAMKNSILPLGLLVITGLILSQRKRKYFGVIMIAVIVADLTRAGWKFLPEVKRELVFPAEKIIDFLTDKSSQEVFRIDREHGEVLPPNLWAGYGLMSPSGYDSLAPKDYVSSYSRDLNGSTPVLSRYSELGRYDAEALGKYNVKYLLAIKRDEKGRMPGDKLTEKINQYDWIRVMETENVAVLENKRYQPRITGGVIESYTPGKVVIGYSNSEQGKYIKISDAYYPGWVACEKNRCQTVEKDGAFMKFTTQNTSGKINLVYRPESFRNGMILSGLALLVWVEIIVFGRGGREKEEIRSGSGFPF